VTNYSFKPLGPPGLTLVGARRSRDERGWLSEVYSEAAFTAAGFDVRFVQDNRSWTEAAGVIRGLHFQRPPHAQAKLFWVTRGGAYNVCVDLRSGAGFGAVDQRVLDSRETTAVLIPEGFAHGFQSLEPETEVHYKLSRDFAPEGLGGLRWDDPRLEVIWPLPVRADLLSERDRAAAPLAALAGLFGAP
jgi:dTDP-4-dehydrorhamnose 3,5-epimerase